jgi:alkanesulfonate monooxygenase SsuD/methylene tetrahydromethanopterin reductase-like flavin-dependent oxidoreductase (luciferase family)
MTVPEMLALARTADQSGVFDSIWIGDSLTAKPRMEAIGLFGALAGVTERVRMGVGCMASFPVRDPLIFAYQWATLDQLSGGRMLLAACTGIVAHEKASAKEGAHWGVLDKERAARMEENIAICRKLWHETDVSFNGRWTSFEHLTLAPRPVQNPCPVWIASNPAPGKYYERSMRRVAEMADGWMTVQLFPGMIGMGWEHIQRYLQEAGRDPQTFGTVAYHNANIAADRETALEETTRFLNAYYGPSFTPQMTQQWTAAGTPDECADHIANVFRQGMQEVTIRLTTWQQEEQYARLVEEVIPRVRDRLA